MDAKTKIIVSGHQRVRACKALEIKTILCELRLYENEDKILKDLLETNLRQRGIGNTNPIKFGRCLVELERIYGIRNGNNQHNRVSTMSTPSQEDLYTELGISKDTYLGYKKLTTLIPEFQDLVTNDTISASAASRVISKLNVKEQEELIKSLDITKKLTQTEVQNYVDKLKEKENQIAGYELKLQKIEKLEKEINELNEELTNRPSTTVEVKPSDYDITKNSLEGYKKDYTKLKSQYDEKIKEITTLKEQIESAKSVTEEEQYTKKLKDGAIFFCSRVNEFIEKTGGFVWLSEHITELPDYERKSYIKAIEMVENWATAMKMNMKQYLD